jgi:hypothetical protein
MGVEDSLKEKDAPVVGRVGLGGAAQLSSQRHSCLLVVDDLSLPHLCMSAPAVVRPAFTQMFRSC